MELKPRQFQQRLSDHGPLGDHHIQRCDRDVEQGLVVHFGTDHGPALHVHLLSAEDCNHVVLVNDRGGPGLDDLVSVADSNDEDPEVFGQRLEFRHGLVHQIGVRHTVGADIE